MGAILGATIVLVIVVATIVGAVVVVSRTANASRPLTELPEYRNHLAMARWIEHVLDDDLERACIPEERQVKARHLLSAFYNERELEP